MNFKNKTHQYHQLKITRLLKEELQFIFILCFSMLYMHSCSTEEDSFTPNASDIEKTINENPDNGDLIGTIATNLTGTLVYNITSQSIENAFTINSSTGEIRINDASKFDFETNQTLSANISVTNSQESATSNVLVTLNNVDDIYSFLNSSREQYENAENGDWIMITENEFNNLSSNLSSVSKSGTSDDELDTNSSIGSTGSNYTWVNDNDVTLPSNSYIFGFKYYSWSNNAGNTRIKVSEGEVTGSYSDIGNVLPEHNSGYNYFVLKGADLQTQNEENLAMYSSVSIGYKSLSSAIYRYESGNSSSISNAGTGAILLFQSLSSTIKQWD